MILHIPRTSTSIQPTGDCICWALLWICNPWCPWKAMCTSIIPRTMKKILVVWHACNTNSSLWSNNLGTKHSKGTELDRFGETLSLNNYLNDKEECNVAPWYNPCPDWSSTNCDRDTSPSNEWYPTDLKAPKTKVHKIGTYMSSRQLEKHGDNHCWHVEMQE